MHHLVQVVNVCEESGCITALKYQPTKSKSLLRLGFLISDSILRQDALVSLLKNKNIYFTKTVKLNMCLFLVRPKKEVVYQFFSPHQ